MPEQWRLCQCLRQTSKNYWRYFYGWECCATVEGKPWNHCIWIFQRKGEEGYDILGTVGQHFTPQENTSCTVAMSNEMQLEKPSLLVLGWWYTMWIILGRIKYGLGPGTAALVFLNFFRIISWLAGNHSLLFYLISLKF